MRTINVCGVVIPLLALLVGLGVVLFSCGISEEEKAYYQQISERNKQAADVCIQAGGIPIYSVWSSRLVDCKFPPEKEIK